MMVPSPVNHSTLMFLLAVLLCGAPYSVHGDSASSCNCSSALQRENWVVGTARSISGKQPAVSTAACCELCSQNDVCVAWVFGDNSCWLKDNTHDGHAEDGRTAGYCSSVGPTPPAPPSPSPPPPPSPSPSPSPSPPPPPTPPSPPPPPEPAQVSAAVTLGTTVVATTDERFVSYTLDWWSPTKGASPEGWGPHATVLELDFESPRLLALVSALGPAYLRIGGSLDKQVVYAFPGTDIKWNSSRCPAKLCLNASRWDQLHTFVASTNSKLVFGLSYPGDKSGVWGSGPAEAVWKYSAAKGYGKDTTMYGFEVGEELTKYRVKTKKFAAYTASYQRAAKLLASIYSSNATHDDGKAGPQVQVQAQAQKPAIMGPCPGMSWPQLATWFPAFLEGTRGALDVAVYHSYNQYVPDGDARVLYCNRTAPGGDVARVHSGRSPGDTGWHAKTIGEYGAAVDVPVWLGEGGPHNGGGGGPEANMFVASFTYLDTLGTLAEVGNAVFARQTLVGGNYELLRCSSAQLYPGETCDFEPRPDYWVALLWHRLMGPETLAPVLNVADGTDGVGVGGGGDGGGGGGGTSWSWPPTSPLLNDLRVYQHCTAGSNKNGSFTLTFSNMADTTVYSLVLPTQPALGRRYEYHLAAANATAGFTDRNLVLNGKPLMTVASSAVLPPLVPVEVAAGEPVVKVAPVSLGFLVFPDAKLAACM